MDLGIAQRRYPQGGVSTLLVMLLAFFCCCSIARADTLPKLHFDIPAGDALSTLQQFRAQAKIQMLYLSDVVRGVPTRAVAGDLNVSEALQRMLEGTGLEITFEDNYTYAAIIRPEKIDTGVETQPVGESIGTPRDPRRGRPDHTLLALADDQKLEEVVVTGTLIHGVLDIMSPLQRVLREDLNRTSYATVQDALRALTLSFGGGPGENGAVGSANQGNFGRGVSANLRGLGAGATLVLIDGYRQPFSGVQGDFVDISSIPATAVERIEVLPDGASALYGSDAIAGVVNVIMRKDVEGGESWVRFGTAPGGADEKLFAQLFGTEWSSGRALFSYQYQERTALEASARSYAANADKRSFGGTDHRSFLSSPGNIYDPRTFRPIIGLTPDGGLSDQINLQNRFATYELLPDRRAHNFYFSGSQNVGERVELFAQGRYGQREIRQQGFAADQLLMVPTTNPYTPTALSGTPFNVVGYSFLDALGPIVGEASTQVFSGVVGLNAKLSESWRMTVSGSYGRERLNSETRNVPDQDALNRALSSKDPALAFNPFGPTNSSGVLDSIRNTQIDTASSAISSATVVADGAVLSLPTGDIKLALGGESREERFGNTLGSGMPFSRQVRSAFAELSVPIIGQKDSPRAVPRLELSLASRYEEYSDFGSTWNPKVGLRWAPSESVKLRTSWATAFKAPRLSDLYDSSHNVATLANFRDPRSQQGTSTVLAFTGNNPDLTQETARTWTGGIDIAFDTMLMSTLSLTYYSIDYTDQIALPGFSAPSEILLHEDQWASVITRNPTAAQVEAICNSPYYSGSVGPCKSAPIAAIVDFDWHNLAATRVKGIDLKIDRPLQTAHGFFQFGLSGSYVLSFEQAVSQSSAPVDVVDTVGNPLALRLRGTAEWYQYGIGRPGFGISAALDYFGAYSDSDDDGAFRGVAALTTLDMRFAYRTPKDVGPLGDLEFMLNATNVFDRAPPFVDRDSGYDVLNNQPYGRVVSFGIQKKW